MRLFHLVLPGFLAFSLCTPHVVMAAASASGNASGLPANINAAPPAGTSMGNSSGLPSGNINAVPSATNASTVPAANSGLPVVTRLPVGTAAPAAGAQSNSAAVPVGTTTTTTGAASSGTGTAIGNATGLPSGPVNNTAPSNGTSAQGNVSGAQGNTVVPLGTSAP